MTSSASVKSRLHNCFRIQFPPHIEKVLDNIGRPDIRLDAVDVRDRQCDVRSAGANEILICHVRLIGISLLIDAPPSARQIKT
jgi:hypothetical protein